MKERWRKRQSSAEEKRKMRKGKSTAGFAFDIGRWWSPDSSLYLSALIVPSSPLLNSQPGRLVTRVLPRGVYVLLIMPDISRVRRGEDAAHPPPLSPRCIPPALHRAPRCAQMCGRNTDPGRETLGPCDRRIDIVSPDRDISLVHIRLSRIFIFHLARLRNAILSAVIE